jgi:cytochrome c-type biogenesis protein CcmE
MSRGLKILITVVVAVGGIGMLAYSSMGEVTLYEHVEEVVVAKDKFLEEKQLQVHGYARKVPPEGRIEGELIWREFELENEGAVIYVRHQGVVPDTFKEQAETVVTGVLSEENGKLILTTVGGEKGIMAKCPSKYEEAKRAKR